MYEAILYGEKKKRGGQDQPFFDLEGHEKDLWPNTAKKKKKNHLNLPVNEVWSVEVGIIDILFQFTVIYLEKQVKDTVNILLPLQPPQAAKDHNTLWISSVNCQNFFRGISRTIN